MHYDIVESGKRIKNFRKNANMTQEELAERIGVTREYIGRIERGLTGASIDLMIELCLLFDTTLDYLVMGKRTLEEMHNKELRDIISRLQNLL